MGRVARYKKTKSFDRQSRRPGGNGEYIWGDESTIGLGGKNRVTKKRSMTAEKLHRQKLNRRKKGTAGADDDDGGGDDNGGGGAGGFGGSKSLFDVAPSGKDDFSLMDAKFTVKREKAHDVQEDLRTADDTDHNCQKKNKKQTSAASVEDEGGLETKPIATVTHNRVKVGKHTLSCTIPQTDEDERRISRLLNVNHRSKGGGRGDKSDRSRNGSSDNASEITKLEGRREGESITKFNKRLREETKMALLQDKLKSRKRDAPQTNTDDGGEEKMTKAQRRKEYLNEKKRRKKGGRVSAAGDDDGYDSQTDTGKRNASGDVSSSSFITGERASFLDQVERPPTFKQLPRGAIVHKKSKMAGVDDGKGGMNERGIKKEQNAMEALRLKVVAQYAMVRARRRMEGGGHS